MSSNILENTHVQRRGTTPLLEEDRILVYNSQEKLAYGSAVISAVGCLGLGGYAIYSASQAQAGEAAISALAAATLLASGGLSFFAGRRQQRPHAINRSEVQPGLHYVPASSHDQTLQIDDLLHTKPIEMLNALAEGTHSEVEQIPERLRETWARVAVRIDKIQTATLSCTSAPSSPRQISEREDRLRSAFQELHTQNKLLSDKCNLDYGHFDELLGLTPVLLPKTDLGDTAKLWNQLDLELRRRDYLLKASERNEALQSYRTLIETLTPTLELFGINLRGYDPQNPQDNPLDTQYQQLTSSLQQLFQRAQSQSEALAEQSAHAQNCETLKAKLAQATRNTQQAASDLSNITEQKERAEEQIRTLEAKLEEAKEAAETAKSDAIQKATALQSVSSELSRLAGSSTTDNPDSQLQIQSLQKELETAKHTAQDAQLQIKDLQEELETAERSRQEALISVETLRQSTESSNSEHADSINQLNLQIQQMQKEEKATQEALGKAKQELNLAQSQHQSQIQALGKQLSQATTLQNEQRTTCTRLRTERDTAKSEHEKVLALYSKLQPAWKEQTERAKALTQKVENQNKELGLLGAQLKEASSKASKTEEEYKCISQAATKALGQLKEALASNQTVDLEPPLEKVEIDHLFYRVIDEIYSLANQININHQNRNSTTPRSRNSSLPSSSYRTPSDSQSYSSSSPFGTPHGKVDTPDSRRTT